MFSEMLQKMLNSTGQAAAMQRAMQMNKYIDNFYKNQAVQNIQPPANPNVQSFEKVLSASQKVNFGSLLLNPESLKVKAELAKPAEDTDTTPANIKSITKKLKNPAIIIKNKSFTLRLY